MSHEINLQQEVKGTARARTATSFGSGAGTTTSQSYTPRVKREGTTSSSGLSAIEWETLMKEGRWFYCKEKGHMTFECPKKKANVAQQNLLLSFFLRYYPSSRSLLIYAYLSGSIDIGQKLGLKSRRGKTTGPIATRSTHALSHFTFEIYTK